MGPHNGDIAKASLTGHLCRALNCQKHLRVLWPLKAHIGRTGQTVQKASIHAALKEQTILFGDEEKFILNYC